MGRPEPLTCDRPSQGLRLMSDLHFGASTIDYAAIKNELDDAVRCDERVLLGGDIFDFILPGDRKRYAPSAVHERLQGRDDLIDASIEWAVEFLEPYAYRIDAIGTGNHESAVERHHHTDAVRRLVKELNRRREVGQRSIQQLGYTGFVEYRILAARGAARPVSRYVLFYTHGVGGCSTSHKALERLLSKTKSFAADLYWSGHYHAKAHASEVMVHCGRDGKITGRDVKCVLTSSYMYGYGNQSQDDLPSRGRRSNYAANEAMAPHGLGGSRVVLHWDKPGFPSRVEVVQ